ncbi:maleylpyruvate isomerase N-terminal domain-containing protein [Streptomyces sp. CA-252508]|uniref:maleylpyruvate isomerase N-terminal domain-containing protein n=1 Tax=Streptomyces sp. CA-252508 TaxID=3418946 RepID=UPI003D91CCA0
MTGTDHHPESPSGLLHAVYGAFMAAVREIDDEASWAPTGCTGWAARDLVFHCLTDAQRALNALHTPTDAPPDRDAVGYWADWRQQDAEGRLRAAHGRRFARTVAGMFLHFGQLRELYLETAAAALHAVDHTDPARRVVTQGHVLTAGDLVRTLAVEATIHHLDLDDDVRATGLPGPSPEGLAEVRRTLDGLLGRPVPVPWDDVHYIRAVTGRAALTPAERAALGPDADRLPLIG